MSLITEENQKAGTTFWRTHRYPMIAAAILGLVIGWGMHALIF